VTAPGPESLICVVPADVAVILLSRAGLDAYRRRHRGENPRVDRSLLELTTVALRYRTMTDRGRNRAPGAVTGSGSRQLTTSMAADRTGVSARTIRRAITDGRLPAERLGHSWVLDAGDVDQWHQRR